MLIRVYNYNTLERVHQFEAHSDYIRSIAIHPTQSYLLTSSGMIQYRQGKQYKLVICFFVCLCRISR
jgi:WD40 repeat protein